MTRAARTLGHLLAFAAVCTVIYVASLVAWAYPTGWLFFKLGPTDFARALAAVAAVGLLVGGVVVHVERRAA
jgi:hypothetical protein